MGLQKRIPLNSPFVKLGKKYPSLKGILTGHFEKSCLDVDMETGEVNCDAEGNELRKMVRVLKFTTTDGMPVQLFETGGLKANREIIEEHGPRGIEILWNGKTELNDGKKSVNDYSIFPLDESEVSGLTTETSVKKVKAVKHA